MNIIYYTDFMENTKSNLEKSSERRLSILTIAEQQSIYGIPRFNVKERKHYFKLNNIEKEIFDNELKGSASKIYFVLSLGYFKVTHQFFHLSVDAVIEDAEHVSTKYLPEIDISTLDTSYGKRARLNHYSHILKLFSFRFASNEDRVSLIENKLGISLKRSDDFSEIINRIKREESQNKKINRGFLNDN